MTSHIPTYMPSPSWDIPADSDLVVLGRLIKDPKNPQSKIPKSNDDPLTPSSIYQGGKTDWATTLEQLRSGKIGLWAKCLQLVQGGVGFSQLKSSMESHQFDVLETRYFLPDDEYIAQVLEDPGVKAYLKVHNYRKPVYLITGIKTARGASVSSERNSERSAQAELKLDATGAGAPVEVGPDASWSSGEKRGVSYGGSTDYIFAYQLARIKVKKGGADFRNETFVKGAAYGKGDEDGDATGTGGVGVNIVCEEETGLGFQDTLDESNEHR